MDSLDEAEARQILSERHYCDDAEADDWKLLDKPQGAFNFEQGLVTDSGKGTGLVVQLNFYRSSDTGLITLKMSVFRHMKKQPKARVYQLQITTLARSGA